MLRSTAISEACHAWEQADCDTAAFIAALEERGFAVVPSKATDAMKAAAWLVQRDIRASDLPYDFRGNDVTAHIWEAMVRSSKEP